MSAKPAAAVAHRPEGATRARLDGGVASHESGPAAVTTPEGMRPAAYSSPLDWTFFAELFVLTYCIAGAAVLVRAGEALWAMPMITWALCMGLMAQQQMSISRAT